MGLRLGWFAAFDSWAELLQPIRAGQRLPPEAYLTKPIKAQKDDRRQQQSPKGGMKLSKNHSGKSDQPKGPSGENYNRVNAMNVHNQRFKIQGSDSKSMKRKIQEGIKLKNRTSNEPGSDKLKSRGLNEEPSSSSFSFHRVRTSYLFQSDFDFSRLTVASAFWILMILLFREEWWFEVWNCLGSGFKG